MKTLLVTIDTNDADYIREIVEMDEKTLEHYMPLIEKIKNFQPYCANGWRHHSNFPVGDCLREDLGEKHPMELYDITEEEYEYFIDAFKLYGGEWVFILLNLYKK